MCNCIYIITNDFWKQFLLNEPILAWNFSLEKYETYIPVYLWLEDEEQMWIKNMRP